MKKCTCSEGLSGKVIAIFLLASELGSACYLTFMSWLLSSWFIDDSIAFRMTNIDWYKDGAHRFAIAVGVAIAFGFATYIINGLILKNLFEHRSRFRFWISVGFAVAIGIAGLAGSIEFIITKPFM
jgi:hypothetical protein